MSWHTTGWHSLASVTIDAHVSAINLYRLTGQYDGRNYSMYFSAREIVAVEIVRIRKVGLGEFELSMLDYNSSEKTWYSWGGRAYVGEDRALRATPLAKSIVHAHGNKNSFSQPQQSSTQYYLHTVMPQAVHWQQQLKPPHLDKPKSELIKCPHCRNHVKETRLKRHIRLVHGETLPGVSS
ncbi:hypothetical protein [Azohydromonas lata]|uniref:hypothetical protein n=1 Tax=Azohydromonas lata TaxID=45677 RepID=UPI0012F4C897|nr:hypothetical protein [Azohydromonas lata]